jgi:hypothetical protein
MVTTPIQPILVLPVYRGGDRFKRALRSLRGSEQYFSRIVISLNSPSGSPDEDTVAQYKAQGPTKIEVIQSGTELPWMPHQYFWLSHLEESGAKPDDWLYWFAHDDEIKPSGIRAVIDADGNWPLVPGTIYFGPWAMRHDEPEKLFDGRTDTPLESWTSFPIQGPLELPVAEWIAQQLIQPTYINMSGCITTLRSFQAMRDFIIAKPGGMRIEMATAAAPHNLTVAEFPEPVVITYGCAASDRTKYAKVARKDDRHMIAWLMRYIASHPSAALPTARAASKVLSSYARHALGKGSLPAEDWRYRETVGP